uniref:Lipoprotein n=1 Tax=Mycoplasma feriruminatoris TaxID=1179777 RepID=A0A654IBL8_9MOLU|nr:hypothetical protein MF5292_00738 [Mycoplasma feriruminatoris]VZR75705.1 hypothetical protein MF5294_00737 [Mycoplasma feriruminatoris]VZR98310.1 hypothetical protein MF5293_00733 [Mycoplasma feriruminatoris]
MKKLLTFLSSFSLITTTSLFVISCKTNQSAQKSRQDINIDEEYADPEHMPVDDPNATRTVSVEEVRKKQIKAEKIKRQATSEEKKKLENIFSEYENSFGTFHTYQDVVDQLLVYAKEQGIDDLTLSKTVKKDEYLKEDKQGSQNNAVKLNLYATPMVFKPKKVLLNEVEEIYNGDQLIQIGYKLEPRIKSIEMKKVNEKTKKVPKHLPLKINSLNETFKKLESDRIDNLDQWDTKNIKYLTKTFNDAKAFNQDISSWNVSNVFDMTETFAGAEKFSKSLNSWDTSNVKDMNGLFWDAKEFNGDISKWNVKNVRDMSNMFSGAAKFNQDLNEWNTSNVVDMLGMFSEAVQFNGKISNWDVSNVADMERMFQDAKSFEQNLNSWKPLKITQITNFRKNAETKFTDDKLPQFSPEILKKVKSKL